MDRWIGRVALVTGASSGIGAAIATALIRHKMTVIGCGRQVDKIKALSDQLSAEKCEGHLDAVQCDLRKESDIKAMFDVIKSKYGRLDVCVNNAGLMHRASPLGGSTESWREMLEVNVLALCIVTREAFKLMKDNGIDDGQIINISSMSGHRLVPTPELGIYQATKFAVRALTESIRVELRQKKSNIRVAEISPGVVETEFFVRGGGQEYADKVLKNLKPLDPKNIADSVLYILSAPPDVQVHDILMRSTSQIS